MKKPYLTLLLIMLVTLFVSGCASRPAPQNRVTTTPLMCDPKTTPPGEQCVIEYNGNSSFSDGEIAKALFVAGGECYERFQDEHGQVTSIPTPCPKKLLGMKWADDRGNVLLKTVGGATVSALGDVLSAREIRKGRVDAARASAQSGPGVQFINLNDVRANSGSSSGAAAANDTDIGIGISDNSCPDCYKPK